MFSSRRLYIAGINIRFTRSPLAPKKMTLHESVMRLDATPARSGLTSALAAPSRGAAVCVTTYARAPARSDCFLRIAASIVSNESANEATPSAMSFSVTS
jgi:hypothetical protein